MDVTKIQKLNDMANNLKKHNIGYSSDGAISAAERIYGSENEFSREIPEQQVNELDELRKEVRKLTIAMQHVVQDLKELKEKNEKLEKELNDARVGISRQRTNEQRTLREEPERDLNKPIDRNNIAPSEVSVEKFFYYGK